MHAPNPTENLLDNSSFISEIYEFISLLNHISNNDCYAILKNFDSRKTEIFAEYQIESYKISTSIYTLKVESFMIVNWKKYPTKMIESFICSVNLKGDLHVSLCC